VSTEITKWPYNTVRWRKLRRRQLTNHPLCQCPICGEGKHYVTVADTVDHKRAHRGDPVLAFDENNLQSMSKTHHDRFKQSEEQGGQGFSRGCDENGDPLYPNAHWRS
jgi:5-methylcytosine-specific restriction endonuclease McrA